MIKVKNLNKYFYKNKKNEIHVLNDVSLDLGEKGLVAIHGASGSGKTTLLNVIGGLDKVHSGEIEFYDEYLTSYKSSVWDRLRNEHIGYIFQNYYLLPDLSVYENIRFVLKNIGLSDEEDIEKRVHYVLKAVGMYPFRKKKALQLSGGQQQRVAIARALVKSPKVILADEPTGNLDSKNSIEIMNIIKQISKETLVILVTHEKELANVYADRIVYVEDGKIIKDVLNDNVDDHDFADDTIYLKDIKSQQTLENDNVDIKVYSDEPLEKLSVRLIYKNETLYLDVDGYDNVKIADKSSGVIIKDEHYKKKTKEEVTKTSFNVQKLDHSNIKKEKGVLFSLKKTFKLAFTKLLSIGRKGKLMLFSFFVAGMIIAFGVASLAAVAIIRPEQTMNLPKGYVEFRDEGIEPTITIKDLNEKLKGTDESFYVNPYSNWFASLNFLNSDRSQGLSFSGNFDNIEHAKKYPLALGAHSNDINEIVITTALADEILNDSYAQEFGIWNRSNLLKERIEFTDHDAKIVGIVKSEIKLIFAHDAFFYQTILDVTDNLFYFPYESYKNVQILRGLKPDGENEIVVSSQYLEDNFVNASSLTFPVDHDVLRGSTTITYHITGVHDTFDHLILANIQTLKDQTTNRSMAIYSSNPSKTIKDLKEEFNVIGFDVYKKAVDELRTQKTVNLLSSLTTTLVLVGVTLVGFYFVIRSSLIERIYEIAVYRALGVKKSEIARSFLVEIITITTITSFIGFVLMSYILSVIQKGFIGQLNFFYVNSLSVISGILVVYGLNIIAGLLPIFMLLRKTPAQILSQYDI